METNENSYLRHNGEWPKVGGNRKRNNLTLLKEENTE